MEEGVGVLDAVGVRVGVQVKDDDGRDVCASNNAASGELWSGHSLDAVVHKSGEICVYTPRHPLALNFSGIMLPQIYYEKFNHYFK